MFQINDENVKKLHAHNIRISEIKPSDMSQTPKIIHLPKVRMLRGGRASGIRITDVKSIKPPDPELVKQQEEEKRRAQVEKDNALRSRTCAHDAYPCTLPAVSGRAYCGRHILDDPGAPYRQCAHSSTAGVRCSMPAPADREHGLCFERSRAALQARQRSNAPPPPVTTTETLLNQLRHYVRSDRTRTASSASMVSVVSDAPERDHITTLAADPFKELDARAVNASVSSALMECASASDSDADSVTAGGGELPISDTEDAPCETMPLWRAQVLTAEEAVSEAKTVLTSLRAAYVKQMGRLRVMLQTARLDYLRALKTEKEHYCSINSMARNGNLTPRERRQLRQLKAYASYHRPIGPAAVLARKLQKRRSRVRDVGRPVGAPPARCRFADEGVRCETPALPAARYCIKHVLNDPHQVLFTSCADTRGLEPCREVTPCGPLAPTCRYHASVPHYTTFTLKKEDTDSETESHVSSNVWHTEEQELEQKPEPDILEENLLPEVVDYD